MKLSLVRVLADTSFLMHMATKSMDSTEAEAAFGRLDFIVLQDILYELTRLSRGMRTKRSKTARTALKYANSLERVSLRSRASVDEKLLRYAKQNKVAVATLDRRLRRTLLTSGVTVLSISGDVVTVDYASQPKPS